MCQIKIIVETDEEKLNCHFLNDKQYITGDSIDIIDNQIQNEDFPTFVYKGDLFESADMEKVIDLKKKIKNCHMILCTSEAPFALKTLFREIGIEIRDRHNGLCKLCIANFELVKIAQDFVVKHIDSKKYLRTITRKAIYYIINDISKSNLKDISKQIRISSDYLSSIFKQDTGYSFRNFLNELKIFISKELLINKKFDIAIIAEKLGYTDLSNFYRFFKKHTGTTPMQFVENYNDN